MSEMFTIRKLDWVYNRSTRTWHAKPFFGAVEYMVWNLGGTWVWSQEFGFRRYDAESCDAAKLAAEAHWQARIKQALVAVEVKQHDGSGQ